NVSIKLKVRDWLEVILQFKIPCAKAGIHLSLIAFGATRHFPKTFSDSTHPSAFSFPMVFSDISGSFELRLTENNLRKSIARSKTKRPVALSAGFSHFLPRLLSVLPSNFS